MSRLEGARELVQLSEQEILRRIVSSAADRSPRGLASSLRELIRGGELPAGTRLPTVRALATALHVSASTLSEAWSILAKEGLIHGAGRRGTVVLRLREVQSTKRLGQMTWIVGRHRLDLSTGTPDSALLPRMRWPLNGYDIAAVENYQGPTVLPQLEEVLREEWPRGGPYAMTMTHGAYDAIDRVLAQVLNAGDRVLIEDPSAPLVVDLVEAHQCVPVAVALDEEGVTPASLRTGLLTRPAALVLQPRAQNPLGIAMTAARAEELASMLHGTKVMVIEDDHCGAVSVSPQISLLPWLPEQVVRILGFSKSYGPDLRLAAMSAPPLLMHDMELRRRLGGGWESRLLQHVLFSLLVDPEAMATVECARKTYQARRRAMVDAAEARGLRTYGHDGLNLWVEVEGEAKVMRRLAAADIGVCPGSPLVWSRPDRSHIRITTATLEQRFEEVADLIAG